HRRHDDGEPGGRRDEPDLAGERSATEQSTARRRSEDDEASAREVASQSDQSPGSDANSCRNDDQVHQVDEEAHGRSLRLGSDQKTGWRLEPRTRPGHSEKISVEKEKRS